MSAKKENEVAVSIPLDDIERIEIYLNKPNPRTRKRKSLSAIISATGADYAINGTLYNMRNGNPVCPLRRNGVTLYHGKDLYRGYLWDNYNANSFHFDLVPNEAWGNFIACSHILMDGKAIKKPIYNVAQGGKRGRTAIGTKYVNGQKRLCLYASKDGSLAKKTPEQLAKLLEIYGWQDAVMLDCGGSSQVYLDHERRQVCSSRNVAHVILIYLKKGRKYV